MLYFIKIADNGQVIEKQDNILKFLSLWFQIFQLTVGKRCLISILYCWIMLYSLSITIVPVAKS